jgi:hypothetical protein
MLDKTGDYSSCRFDVFLDNQKFLTFIESVTGTAAVLISGNRSNAGQTAFDIGLRRVHGLIDIGDYAEGQTIEHWVTAYEETPRPNISDEDVRNRILQALYRGMRHNPTGYKYERTDVEGFCEVLRISKKSFEFNATFLFEQKHIQRTPGDQYSLRDGAICITSKGGEFVERIAAINRDLPSKVCILFLAADPTDASRLRVGQELREIQEKLQLSARRDQIELFQRMSVRPEDVSQALLDVTPTIVHFSGHGTTGGELCFEDELGQARPVKLDALAALFEQFTPTIKCVVLNACYSEEQARVIANHIDNVIGMNEAIGDKAAIAFAVGFYQALGAGRNFEEAFKLGCVQIQLQGIPEHLIPVLVKRQ